MPKNWVQTNLETVIERMSNGSGLKQFEEPFENSFPISRIETIWNETIDLDRVKYVNPTQADIVKYSFLKGDVLFSHINSDKHLGKTAVFNLDTVLIHGINLLLLRAKPQFNGYLLNYFLRYYRTTASGCQKDVHSQQPHLCRSDQGPHGQNSRLPEFQD